MTDLTDDDLYQAPGLGTGFALSAGPAYLTMSFTNPGVASAELSQILNVPDNFFENYSRRNGSNMTLNTPSSAQSQETFDSYDQTMSETPQIPSPFNAYATSDSFYGQTPQLNHNQQYQQYYQPLHQHQQQQTFVQPLLIQMRSNMRNPGRTGRITTLGDHESSMGKPNKDEDFYLFNTDIQPSQMLATKNYFNPEDATNSSLYIMNSDLDHNMGQDFGFSVPGVNPDYAPMDEFFEDAEALSEDSDDDNCFQDDYGEDDFGMSYEQLPTILPFSESSSDNFMSVVPNTNLSVQTSPTEEEYFQDMHKTTSNDNMDVSLDTSPSLLDNEGTQAHSHNHKTPCDGLREHHKTAAEISATNPEHQCDLINPSNGKPCNRKFSRPYDLIRHQETIHASEKKIYRCVICEGRANGGPGNGKQKTFSRNDALSRHIKVKHGLGGQEAIDLINEAKENVEYVMV